MVKSVISIILTLSMAAFSACGLSEKSFLANENNVKQIGRTYLADDDVLWLAQSASGVEFTFTGTKASVTIVGDNNAAQSWSKDNQARFAVYVDGERVIDEIVKEAEKTYEIWSAEEKAEKNVRIVKLSECANSILGIKNITASCVGDIKPTEEKPFKIEFIGDSITCGYGVDDEVKENHFSTQTEDATKAYAVKTAELLDADYSLVSFSGHGIISGYSGDKKKHTDQCVPDFYTKIGRSYSNTGNFTISDINWDFSKFVPDVIVVNLGTNDDSYCAGDPEKEQEYSDAYVDFIADIRANNPDAHIICALGIMGDRLYPAVEAAVTKYTEESGDSNVSALKFDVQSQADGYAADWHPTAATHDKAAKKMAEEIKKYID